MDHDDETAPHTRYVRDSFDRFYAPRPDEHEPAEPWDWRLIALGVLALAYVALRLWA